MKVSMRPTNTLFSLFIIELHNIFSARNEKLFKHWLC